MASSYETSMMIRIFGDSKSLQEAARKADSAISSTGVNLDKLAKTAAFSSLAAGAVAFGKESVRAAIDDKASQEQLRLALENSIGARTDQVKSAEAYIAKLQDEVGILDDQLRPAYSTLVRATRDQAEAQKLLALASDISAGKGVDMAAASDALAKAYQGNTKGLRNLGIELKGADGATRSFTDISKELTQLYGGAAKKAFDADPAKQFGVQMENLKETVGNALLPVVKELAGGLSDILGWFNHLDPAAQKTIVWIGLVGGGAFAAVKAFTAMKAALIEVGVAAESTMTMMGGIGLAIAAVVTVVSLFSSSNDEATVSVKALSDAAASATDSIDTQKLAMLSAADAAKTYAGDLQAAMDKTFRDLVTGDPKMVTALQKMGLSLDDVTNATRDQSEAKKVLAKLDDEWYQRTHYTGKAQTDASDHVYALSQAIRDQIKAIADNNKATLDKAAIGDLDAIKQAKGLGILGMLTDAQQKQAEAVLDSAAKHEALVKAQNDQTNATQQQTAAVKDNAATFVDAQSKYFDVVDALAQMQSSMQDGNASFMDQQRNVLNAKKTLAEYAKLLDLPTAQVTEIMALLDKGSYDQALKVLNRLTAPKTIELIPMLSTKGGIQAGRLEDNMDNLGQQAGFTFIDALDKASKAAAKSSGAGGGAGKTAAEKAAEAYKATMDKQDAMFELGEMDPAKYRRLLQERIRHFAKYSQDYMTAVRALKQLDDAVAKKKADDAKAEQDALAKKQAAEDAELARAAQRAIVAADITGATYLTVNTDADPNAIVRALRDYVRMNGKIVGVTA